MRFRSIILAMAVVLVGLSTSALAENAFAWDRQTFMKLYNEKLTEFGQDTISGCEYGKPMAGGVWTCMFDDTHYKQDLLKEDIPRRMTAAPPLNQAIFLQVSNKNHVNQIILAGSISDTRNARHILTAVTVLLVMLAPDFTPEETYEQLITALKRTGKFVAYLPSAAVFCQPPINNNITCVFGPIRAEAD